MPAISSSRAVQKAEAKYNVTTEYPNYGLHSAAASGNIGLVSFALTNGQPTNAVLDGVLPLHAAASGRQAWCHSIDACRESWAGAATILRDWAASNPPSNQPTSPSTPSIGPTSRSLQVKRSLETLFRRPWGGSRLDLSRLDHSVSRIDLTAGGGELGSGSSGVDLGAGESQSELGELGYLPPLAGGPPNNDSRRPSLPTPSGTLPGSKSQRPRSAGTTWSGGKDRVRKLFGRSKKDDLGWDSVERVEVDWAEEVEFRRGERVAVEMGLKAPSARLLAAQGNSNVGTKKGVVRQRRKASEFHPDPEFDFLDDEPGDGRVVVRDDDGDIEDYRDDPTPVKRVLHPRSSSHCSPTRPGFSTAGMSRLTSPSMPSLPLPANIPSLMTSAATSTTSVPSATSPVRSHAPSPGGHTHVRSISGSSITRRGLRASSSFSSFLPRQPEETMPSSGESTVAGSAPVTTDPAPQLQGQEAEQNAQDGSLLQPPDSRFRGDSLSSTSSENTNQLSSSMATTDTNMTVPSLYSATSPLPLHKGTMTFSPVFEADDLDELEEVHAVLDGKRRSITPLNLRSVSTFEQAQNLVRQAEREILEPGPQGPDSPSLAEQLAAYGESLAIERRFARGEAQRRAWEAERTSREGRGDEDEEEDGYEYENSGPRIALPLGRTASVDYHTGGKFGHVRTPSRTQTAPVRHTVSPLSSAFAASQTRTPERPSFSTASSNSQQRLTSNLRAIPRRTASDRSSYISRPSSIEIIETAATPIESPPSRGFELHRRSASTGVSNYPWSSSNFGTTNISQSPDQSDGDSHYELNSRTAPLSRITTAPSKIGNAIGSVLSRDPNYEPHRRKKLKRFVKQLAGATVS
ncbi:ankyrin repeats [Ceratobasidium sp. AG-Ba]|nr:ankyrin repeats [Ceratobasidium sp. AG-Ba]QRW08223.1 ankyrin repeats [Ceratobasidium sp. AG-Ba]